ncbi:SMP-30/gluconolactonase/LRE family protein [Streptomyces sp. NPDC051976]|uniref:SMP-30/gluconolactonase/LRE family protein n=1 Tax=Streptomyces sp. NPDC051976 TaxID=3154947 RepID=UPI0034361682
MSADWVPLAPDRYHLAEGARWHHGRLLFVDLLAGDLYTCGARPGDTPDRLLGLGVPLGAAEPLADGSGGWIVAAGTGIAAVGPDGRVHWLGRPEEHAATPMRMNDGACDPSGRFWAGSMAADGAPGAGSLYRVDPDGSVHRALTGLSVPNGPAFSPSGTVMYLADSGRGDILRYPLDAATGELGQPSVLVTVPIGQGRPDGMTVDDDGLLWVALWGAGQVRAYTDRGSLECTVPVPTPHVSSVAFGGGRMFVTTARHRLSRPDVLAGAVLSRPCAVTAPAARAFGAAPRAVTEGEG